MNNGLSGRTELWYTISDGFRSPSRFLSFLSDDDLEREPGHLRGCTSVIGAISRANPYYPAWPGSSFFCDSYSHRAWSVDVKQPRRDPATGDVLTTGEYISWIIQGVIRRWAFLVLISIVTAIVWLTDNATALTWWNLGASYLALVIESVVGISMYAQTKRDAIVLREIRAIGQRVEKIAEREAGELAQIEKRLEGRQ